MAHDLSMPTDFNNGEGRNEASALSLSATLMHASSTRFIPEAIRNHKKLNSGAITDPSIMTNSYGSLYAGGWDGSTNCLNSLLGLQFQDHIWSRYPVVETMEEGSDGGMKLVHQLDDLRQACGLSRQITCLCITVQASD